MANSTTILNFAPKAADPALAICDRYGNKPDALLEILHDVQHETGHVPESSLPVIAKALNLSRAEVYGVATFYHDFHLSPEAGIRSKFVGQKLVSRWVRGNCRRWPKNS